MKTIEIQVILHTVNGDVVTTYPVSFHVPGGIPDTMDQAYELFGYYAADGKNASMKTVTKE
jgi:hypothetical protein